MTHRFDTELRYMVNGTPVTVSGLIKMAADINANFKADWCKQTSAAASILRDAGLEVGEYVRGQE